MVSKRGISRPWLVHVGRIVAVLWMSVVLGVGCTAGREAEPTTGGTVPSRVGDSTSTVATVALGPERSVDAGGSAVSAGGEIDRPQELIPVTIRPGGTVLAQLEDLIATTERLRGHRFLETPVVRFVLPDEAARLRGLKPRFGFGTADPDVGAAIFDVLGVFSNRTDLTAFYEDFYASEAGPFYDTQYRELIVPLAGSVLSQYERWALVHELTHALMHQNFPATAAAYLEAAGSLSDLPSALLGLIEGEAVLMQTLFFAELDPEDRFSIIEEANRRIAQGSRDAPRFVQTVARFPYGAGGDFVLDLFGRGGNEALDQAFANPPWETDQVYNPQVYVDLDRVTPQIEAPTVRLPGYESGVAGVWGELGWRALLGQFLNGGRADEAAGGWAADRFEAFWDPARGHVVFLAEIRTSSPRDGSELAGALTSYMDAALDMQRRFDSQDLEEWLGVGYAAVYRDGPTVRLVVASNALNGLQAAGQLGILPANSYPRPDGISR